MVLIFWSCEENILPPANKTIINTGDAINITTNSATLSIFINEVGAAKNIGIIWGENDALDSDNQIFNVSLSNGVQQGYISISSPGTYYYKAYAADKYGNYVYGETRSFIIENEKISVSSNSIQAGAIANTYNVSINSNTSWTAISDQNWCKISPNSGMNNGSLSINIDENNTTSIRNAKITIRTEKHTQEIILTQSQTVNENSLIVSSNYVTAAEIVGSYYVNISCNQAWTALSNQSWCTLQSSSGTGNKALLINTSANTSTNDRTAIITITSGEESQQIFVTQYSNSHELRVGPRLYRYHDHSFSGGSGFGIKCTGTWEITSDQVWCTIYSSSSGTGDDRFNYSLKPNLDYNERIATITVSSSRSSQQVKIIQRGKPKQTPNSTPQIDMIFVQGGTFTMGDTFGDGYDNEKPTHKVTLSSFYIGKYEVTQAQWKAVMNGENPSQHVGDNLPVGAYLRNIKEFIAKLNQLSGKKYRLPTEAEWEYAAKGGNKSNGYKYSGSNIVDNVAWYGEAAASLWSGYSFYGGGDYHLGNAKGTIHFVGSKQANELGIYDMSGNITEFCSDWYSNYNINPQVNPTGPESGTSIVTRGGGYGSHSINVRCSDRSYSGYSEYVDSSGGFRLALDIE